LFLDSYPLLTEIDADNVFDFLFEKLRLELYNFFNFDYLIYFYILRDRSNYL